MSREIEKEVFIRQPPDIVWKAIAEAEELARWFPLEARVTPGVGGSIWLSWGPGAEGEAPITAWEPGRRLQWTETRGPIKLVVDFHLEAKNGGTVVRLVQSGFGDGTDWDGEYHMTGGGWSYFVRHLQWYLERHRGVPRDVIAFRARLSLDRPEAYARLVDALQQVRTETLVESAATHQLGLTLPDVNDAILFLEMEPSPGGTRAGFWLSTYGLPPDRLEQETRRFADLYRGAFDLPADAPLR